MVISRCRDKGHDWMFPRPFVDCPLVELLQRLVFVSDHVRVSVNSCRTEGNRFYLQESHYTFYDDTICFATLKTI